MLYKHYTAVLPGLGTTWGPKPEEHPQEEIEDMVPVP